MEKSFVHHNEGDILKEFEEWFIHIGKQSLKSTISFNMEHIFQPTDNEYYCLKIDFDSKNYLARLTLWDNKSIYLEAMDFNSSENFINENYSFSKLKELLKKVSMFINQLNDRD